MIRFDIYQHIPYFGINGYGGTVMQKNTSITLGEHFDSFISQQIQSGRYASASEAVRAGLRLLEEREIKLSALRRALEEGQNSGFAEYSLNRLIEELDEESDSG
jgi:antitoxin ParD1/3/4